MSLQTDIASLRFRINQLEGGTTTGGGGGAETYFYVSGSETITSSNGVYISGNTGIVLTSSTTNNLLIISSSLAEVISGTINNQTPNSITPINAILATGSAETISIAILPKSSGSFLLSIPDNTAVGGNIRGSGSIDLQRVRDQAFQVAAANSSSILGGIKNEITSGAHFSVLGGGEENIIKNSYYGFLGGGLKNAITSAATGYPSSYSVLVGGSENSSSGMFSFLGGGQNNKMGVNSWQVIAGGRSNNCAGQASFIGSGEFNTIVGTIGTAAVGNFIGAGRDNTINSTTNSPAQYSSILGGTRNVIEASNCVIPGGTQANSLKTEGRFAFASGHFGNNTFNTPASGLGNAQMSILVTRAETTGTTPNYLTTDGSTLRQGTFLSPIYYWNSNYVPGFQAVKAHLIAASSDGEYAYYEISYAAKSTGVLGTPTVTTLFSSAGASTWSIGVFHPGVYSPATAFSVTGSSGKNIRWVATSYTTHLSF